jgi:transglutaminase-like putative cysteine protease
MMRNGRNGAAWLLTAAFAITSTLPALDGTPPPPDWVLTAAHASTPDYPKTTMAVVLDDEETLTVQPDGKATLLKRRVIKILRPQGRGFATVFVPIDRDRKLHSLHVWSIAADGHPYTLRDNEIVEVGDDEYGMLYVDLHAKMARAPAADPGAVVAYEYERTMRPYVQEYSWDFQDSIPTLHSVFELILPPDWHYSVAARNAVADRKDATGITNSQPAPDHYLWQIDRVPGIDLEDVPMTPEFGAMAGRLVARYSRDPQPTGDARWTAIGDWYTGLATPSAQATPDLSAKAKELVAGQTDFTAKIQNIANYMQRNIRYVGIEIGIGGLQPHSAEEVFRNRYGDCKDKATLLRAMLESVGIHSTWVLVDTRRGFVDPAIPSIDGNHAIAAIEIPAGYTNPLLQSVVTTKSGKRYLIFDPTNEWIPIGQIPPYEQGGYGILSESGQSQLIALPVMTPASDRIDHTIHAQLAADGSLEASVVEQRFGYAAERPRVTFTAGSPQQQRDYLEQRLRRDLTSVSIEKLAAEHSTELSHPLELDYSFHVANYARSAGDLLLVRPRILGSDAWSLPRETRAWPIDLSAVQSRTDHIDLTLPPGYVVDELPDAVSLDTDFASYHSAVTADATALHYTREYTVKQLQLDASRYDDLRKFSERVAYDEATSAVLKKK